MDTASELANLKERAKKDVRLREELIKTRNAPDKIKAFCDKCAELGYEHITVYELVSAGEEFCAEMLRSVNGGGVEAPDDWDDFYAMFFDEIERM